jgi:8-oxo-dGTP diphosphatase
MDRALLKGLPSPFYRVAVKGFAFDEQNRLLVEQNEEGEWEIPGGGWEHDESLEQALKREIYEELSVEVVEISAVRLVYQGESERGWHVLRIVVDMKLNSHDFTPSDDMVAARFVTREELLQLHFAPAEVNIRLYVDEIWPPAIDKTAVNL